MYSNLQNKRIKEYEFLNNMEKHIKVEQCIRHWMLKYKICWINTIFINWFLNRYNFITRKKPNIILCLVFPYYFKISIVYYQNCSSNYISDIKGYKYKGDFTQLWSEY